MRPDVVFSTLGHLNLALAILRPVLPKRPFYCARETNIVSQVNAGYAKPWFWNWAYRRFYGRFDLIICQSRAMRDDLVQKYALPVTKAVIIYNPIDVERARALAGTTTPSAADTKLRLLSVGRLSFEKGFDLAVKALALCCRSDIEWTILGDGPLRSEIEGLARTLGVDGQIIFGGFQPNPHPYYRHAHALLVSSRFEGFPNAVLEALACGLPVISTPAPGVVELVREIPGCTLASEISPKALADEISRFTPGHRVAEEALRPYKLETIMKRYEDVFG
jgi:glycosyltransferase involved in cell wall biosynthesis